MFKFKTVFVLGAGASHEVGFPLGIQLKEMISKRLDFHDKGAGIWGGTGDPNISIRIFFKYGYDKGQYMEVCRQISEGIHLSDSVDDFIDKHSHDPRVSICSKLAIAYSIVQAEHESVLFIDPSDANSTLNFKLLGSNWYGKFYSLLTKGAQKSSLEKIFDNLTVINFNYDRSLEHFLVHALSKDYMIEKIEAMALVKRLVIFRPYGSVDMSVPFGLSGRLPDLDRIVDNLKTYTEKIEEQHDLLKVKSAIEKSNAMVFLGMAYHVNNMSLLKCRCNMRSKFIYATRKGLSDNGVKVAVSRILDIGDSNIDNDSTAECSSTENIFLAEDCTDLFEKYGLSLSEI